MIVGLTLIMTAIVIGSISWYLSSQADKRPLSAAGVLASTEPWQAWCASTLVLLAFFCLFSGSIVSFRALQGAAGSFEAHHMLCGTPDCTRSPRICGMTGFSADKVGGLGADGGVIHSKQACCQDLMLRMLVDVGTFLDKHNIEWYITYGTLLGAMRNQSIIPWTDDVDIVIPNAAGQEMLRAQTEIDYSFGRYGSILRGAADYVNVSKKLPHHPSGNGAHMWVNDYTPILPAISCEGEYCLGRQDPVGDIVKERSHVFPNWIYTGRTAYYFMDVYNLDEPTYQGKCNAFEQVYDNGETKRSRRTVQIGGQLFPVHHNAEACLREWYGPDWQTPTQKHVSDYLTS